MCSGRVDLEFILRAFANGQDGVFVGGCRLGECNYVTQGNFDALGNTLLVKKILEHIGLNPERLNIAFMNASDGILLANSINEFSATVKELGPIGKGEDLDIGRLKFKLNALRKLVPYLRLVERERLRVPVRSEKAYREFFDSDDFNRLFEELVVDKLAMSEITTLLADKPLSTGEIAEQLGLPPSDVARHMNTSSMHGLVKYDTAQNSFALA
jgi:F420-non-reducing hydrogenase iron-sulfur subunit